MKLALLTTYILVAGIFIPVTGAFAGVVRSSDRQESNYQIHHRIIIYNSLSSFQNPNNKFIMRSQEYSIDDFIGRSSVAQTNLSDFEYTAFTQSPRNNSRLKAPYTSPPIAQDDIILNDRLESDFIKTSVGSFLDSFKDDPTLRTIYFTSKDLTFSYKKKIVNVLQLGFDMKADDYKDLNDTWRESQEEKHRALTESERKALKRETTLLFGLLSESYKTILFVLIGMITALFLSFRYILNKYI